MTREELKAILTPIICNLDQTKEERASLLGPIALSFWLSTERYISQEEIFFAWNAVIVEIVEENSLAEDGRGLLCKEPVVPS
jgi:hypothetical protein